MYKKNRTRTCTRKNNPKGTKIYEKNRTRTCSTKTGSKKNRPVVASNPRPLDNDIFTFHRFSGKAIELVPTEGVRFVQSTYTIYVRISTYVRQLICIYLRHGIIGNTSVVQCLDYLTFALSSCIMSYQCNAGYLSPVQRYAFYFLPCAMLISNHAVSCAHMHTHSCMHAHTLVCMLVK